VGRAAEANLGERSGWLATFDGLRFEMGYRECGQFVARMGDENTAVGSEANPHEEIVP
jgi:hypothetical protein